MQCAHDLGDLADHEKRWCFSNSVAEQEDEPAAYAVQGDAGQLCLGANRLAAAVFGESQTSVWLYRPTQTYTGRQWFKHHLFTMVVAGGSRRSPAPFRLGPVQTGCLRGPDADLSGRGGGGPCICQREQRRSERRDEVPTRPANARVA